MSEGATSPTRERRPNRWGPVAKLAIGAFVVLAVIAICVFVFDLGVWIGPAGAPPRVHVLLITLDTTRADHLGCMGFRAGDLSPTPELDALAEQGVLFREAYTSSPLTLPSHTTMLTGLEPPQHGVRENEAFRLAPPAARPFSTLAEVLRGAGYRTAAVIAAAPLASEFGLAGGFDDYLDPPAVPAGQAHFDYRPSSEVTDLALEWLDRQSGLEPGAGGPPAFVWVHYFDAHQPLHRYPGRAGRVADAAGSLYAGEIAAMDEQIGRLLAAWRERGLWDETLVIVVGDHGEGLGEHGESTHGLLVQETTLRVPLIVKPPAFFDRRAVERPARCVDLFETVLDVLGRRPDDDVSRGPSLFDAQAEVAAPVLAETVYPYRQYGWAALRAFRAGEWKIIEGAGRTELYHLAGDPSELNDRSGDEPRRAAALLRRMRDHLARRPPLVAPSEAAAPPSVRATSYVSVAAGGLAAEPPPEANRALAHPRDRMPVVHRLDELQLALARLEAGDPATRAEAVIRVQSAQRWLDREAPECPVALFWCGRARLKLAGDTAGLNLSAEHRTRLLQEAMACFDRLLAKRSRDHKARNMALGTLWQQHRLTGDRAHLDELLRRATEQVSLALDDALTHAWRGRALEAAGRPAEALAAFEEAVLRAPDKRAFAIDRDRIRARLEKP